MKKKHVFLISFVALISIISIFICSLYNNVEGQKVNTMTKQEVSDQLGGDMLLGITGMVEAIAPDQSLIEFSKNVDEDTQKVILNDFKNHTMETYLALQNDSNFNFYVQNTKTKEELGNKDLKNKTEKDIQDDSYVYGIVTFDDKGNASIQGDFYDLDISLNRLSYFTDFYFDGEIYYNDVFEISRGDVEIQNPKNIQIKFSIPKDIEDNDGLISNSIYPVYNYAGFTMLAALIGSCVLALYLLFYPASIVKDVNPFLTFRKIKAEILTILLGFGITFGLMGMVYLADATLNGYLIDSIAKYNIHFSENILLAGNVIEWMLLFLMISIAIFEIKFIFVKGFWKFIKEDTIVGSVVCGIHRYMDRLADFDLKDPLHKQLFKFILVQIVIVFILCFFFAFGSFLAIIYGIVLYVWLRKKLEKMQEDYGVILKQTSALKEGNFHVEISDDVGIFESMKDDLQDIRIGFEKAVKEEMKSQNMKTELISNVSHDLKTPLTGIRNYIELLQQEGISEEQCQEYLKMLEQYSHRLQVLMDDLFEISKANSGNIQLEMTKLDIIALVEQVQAECSEGIAEHNLEVIWSLPSEPHVYVMLDGNKAYRIFENLLINVQRYAMEHTRVYIDIKKYANYVRIECKNISKDPLNFEPSEIIERFVRGDKSRHDGGSGLGLAIVKSFTEAMQGTFTIETDGDLFKAILTFPILSDVEETIEQ